MNHDLLISALRLLVLIALAVTALSAGPVNRRPRIERNLLMLGGMLLLLASALDLGAGLSPTESRIATLGFASPANLHGSVLAGYLFGFVLLGLGLLRRPLNASRVGTSVPEEHRNNTDRWTEQALAESEARYKALVENAPEAIMVLDVDENRFVDANDNACRLFQLDRDKLLEMSPDRLSPPKQPDGLSYRTAGHRKQALKGGAPVFEWHHRDAVGNDITCEVRLVRLPSSGRNLIRGSIIDISERKRSELLLAGKGHVLELIAENAPIDETLNAIAGLLEKVCPNARCSILLLDEETKDLRLGVAPSLPQEYVLALDGLPLGAGGGCCGTAAVQRECIVAADLAEDPRWRGQASLALPHGLKACWSTPIFSSEGVVLGTVGMYYDEVRNPSERELESVAPVTRLAGIAIERHRAEHTLRESEARFRRLFNNVAAGVGQTTQDGSIIAVNPALVKLLGYESEDELLALNIRDDVYADRSARAPVIGKIGERGDVVNEEVSLKRKDGEIIHALLSARAVRDEKGDAMFYEGTVTDITKLKRAEAEIRENKNFFELILESVPVMIAYVNARGIIEFSNQSYANLFGSSRTGVTGRHVEEVVSEELFERIRSEMETVLSGEPVSFNTNRDHLGSKRELNISYLPHFSKDGDVLGFFSVVQDMTERSQLEAQLRQAQKMEAVGQLTGGIAHDFNNLLNVILGNLELVETRVARDPRLSVRVQTAVDAAWRGSELTKRLLAFSRRQVLEPRPVSLNQLVAGIEQLLRRTIGEAIEVKMVFSGDLWTTAVDRGQLENALLNLAINGRDAMPEGGKLTIETMNAEFDEAYAARHEEVRAGEYVGLAVTDTGTGMSADVLAQVFEPFFTTKGPGDGSGLGLSMVYGFVKQSGGHAKVYSEVGRGTSVKLYFPRADAPTVEPDERSELEGPLPAANGETVLIVEDDPLLRVTAIAILEELDYRVLVAENGGRAIEVLRDTGSVDLLFTDLVMPGGIDGISLAREARQLQPDIKVLLTTGYAERALVHQDLLDGGSELIGKPYRREQLARRIHALLND